MEQHNVIKARVNFRTVLAIGHDIVASALAWCAAYWLRFNLDIPAVYLASMKNTLFWVVPLQAIVFFGFGLYRGIWRYASLPDLKRIVLAIGLSAALLPLLFYMLQTPTLVPRSVLILDPVILILLMGGSRLIYRAWKEHHLYSLVHPQAKPVLVLGAGDAAVNLLKELSKSSEWRVVGVLDDDPTKQRKQIQGINVLGGLSELPAWAEKLGVENAIIAMPSADHSVRRRAAEICSQAEIKAMTVPSFDDLMSGNVTVSQIRQVELDDLLGRDPVVLDSHGLHDLLTDRVILVSGAGGSIGSELCRQIAKFKPGRLIFFELNEFNLYNIEQEFRVDFPDISIACVIGDVKDRARIEQVLKQHHPHIVFHAAAYKHVPLMEDENAWEAIQNNVLGTYVLAQTSATLGVEKFILISTDKAVNPTNVMGASKRVAEMVCQAIQQDSATRFVMVRFGNVLGSTGSVIPKFREQIAKGGPITVTHPEITRFFMSIPEAAQLVLQAGLMGNGGEIFVMDMGEPVKIVDLAMDLIGLSGFTKDEIKIIYTGLRPGEKLYEELLANDETTVITPHPKLRIAQARVADQKWMAGVLAWLNQGKALNTEQVKRGLAAWVPEYRTTLDPDYAKSPPSLAILNAKFVMNHSTASEPNRFTRG